MQLRFWKPKFALRRTKTNLRTSALQHNMPNSANFTKTPMQHSHEGVNSKEKKFYLQELLKKIFSGPFSATSGKVWPKFGHKFFRTPSFVHGPFWAVWPKFRPPGNIWHEGTVIEINLCAQLARSSCSSSSSYYRRPLSDSSHFLCN